MNLQKEYFNSLAKTWDKESNHDMEKVEYILDLLDIKPGHSVLDVGTGTGVLIPSLYARVTSAGTIKAVDLADKMIEIAQKKHNYNNLSFVCGDVLELKGDEESYDHIVCYSVFPHFQSRKAKAVEILAGKLRKGGKLIICHSQSRQKINELHKKLNEAVNKDELPPMEVMNYYFINAGLRVINKIDNDRMFVIIGLK